MTGNNDGQPLIDRIRDRLPLHEYASKIIKLNKTTGSSVEIVGLCPFHIEKTPSFYVSTEKHVFYCHGCGTSGNVIHLYAHVHSMDYTEAKMELGRELGVVEDSVLVIDSVMSDAALKFHAQLKKKQDAWNYLTNIRKLTPEIIERFGLGFCWGYEFSESTPAHKAKAIDYGIHRAATPRSVEKGHMAGRITFPIRDRLGHIVGFGGRLVPSERPAYGAKYINSPDTKLFLKSELLYGAYEAEATIRSEGFVIVVEGYVDVITLHQHGIENTVGLMGSHAGETGLSYLWSLTKRIVFCLDGDAAGKKGALDSVLAAAPSMPPGCEIVVVMLPGGSDPDEFVIANGKDAFTEMCESGMPLSRFLMNSIIDEYDLSYAEGRVAFTKAAEAIGDRFTVAPEVGVQIVEEARTIRAVGLAAYAIHGGGIGETVDIDLINDAINLLTNVLKIRNDSTLVITRDKHAKLESYLT